MTSQRVDRGFLLGTIWNVTCFFEFPDRMETLLISALHLFWNMKLFYLLSDFSKWWFHKKHLFSAWLWLTVCLTRVSGKQDALLLRESACKTRSDTEGINTLHGLYLRLLLTALFTQRQITSRSVIVLSLLGGVNWEDCSVFATLDRWIIEMLNQCWLSRAASNWKDDAIKIITVL